MKLINVWRVFALILAAVSSLSQDIPDFVNSDKIEECSGGYDVHMLFDRSSSTLDNFEKHVVPFATKLINRFANKNVRTSLIWFGTRAHKVLELTKDHEKVLDTLNGMRNKTIAKKTVDSQATNIGAALQLVNVENTDTNKIVFLVSDGCDNSYFEKNTRKQAELLKEKGVEIHIIYIPSGSYSCPEYLKELASEPTFAHYSPILQPPYYDNIQKNKFLSTITKKSCFEINKISPSSVCSDTRRTIVVSGTGFSKTNNLGKFSCKFTPKPCEGFGCSDTFVCEDNPKSNRLCPKLKDGEVCDSSFFNDCAKSCNVCGYSQAVVINDNTLLCQTPPLNTATEFYFEISRNGVTFTKGETIVDTVPCASSTDDEPLSSITPSLNIKVVEPKPTFSKTDKSLKIDFEITNDGDVAIGAPINLISNDGIIHNCELTEGILSVDESIKCTANHKTYVPFLNNDVLNVTYVAIGNQGENIPFTSEPKNFIFHPVTEISDNDEAEETVAPTLAPTSSPTLAPTSSPTLAPTSSPTSAPTVEPIDSDTDIDFDSLTIPTDEESSCEGVDCVEDYVWAIVGVVGGGAIVGAVVKFVLLKK